MAHLACCGVLWRAACAINGLTQEIPDSKSGIENDTMVSFSIPLFFLPQKKFPRSLAWVYISWSGRMELFTMYFIEKNCPCTAAVFGTSKIAHLKKKFN